MSRLYHQLAEIYHQMYAHIFDYGKDFKFYHQRLQRYDYRKILEIGCGSGYLARYFVEAGYAYTGLDLAAEMLEIARRENPGVRFVQGDMRHVALPETFDAALITGRSFTYMTTNADVLGCLAAVAGLLRPAGLLAFDNFDAAGIFTNFRAEMVFETALEDGMIRRVSRNTLNLENGWTWNWHADYYRLRDGVEEKLGEDVSILRAFTEDELALFLKLSGFETLEIVKSGSAFTCVARKTG